ncbi:MAG: LytTR family DNA-binding domain-containing protein [Bacteroidota bacterium]
MKKLNEIPTCIVEDELLSIDSLSLLVKQYCPELGLRGVARSIEEAIPMIHQQKPELVFLDIHLPEQNGFQLLEAFNPPPFEVIFTTAYDQHAIKAIRVSAIDYLLKPIHFLDLRKAVDRVKDKLMKEEKESAFKGEAREEALQIALPTLDGFQFVHINDILRLEAASNYTFFLLVSGEKIVVSRNIKSFEEPLIPNGFFRIHRSHLVNLKYIKAYKKGKSPQISLSDGSTLSISPKRKEGFEEAISDFLASDI